MTVRGAVPRRPNRIGVAITAGATVVGMWFGYAGPSTSPVEPPTGPVVELAAP
ncbi:hypothetical protein ACNHUS_23325 [Actinomycetes bacterium M1A6_2h]